MLTLRVGVRTYRAAGKHSESDYAKWKSKQCELQNAERHETIFDTGAKQKVKAKLQKRAYTNHQ